MMIKRECFACGEHYDLTGDDVNYAMGGEVNDATSLILCHEHRYGFAPKDSKYWNWIRESAWNNETWDKANLKEVYEVKTLIRGNKYYRNEKKKRDRMMKSFFSSIRSN